MDTMTSETTNIYPACPVVLSPLNLLIQLARNECIPLKNYSCLPRELGGSFNSVNLNKLSGTFIAERERIILY